MPFTDVIIHSTVLAPDGRRMSKSLGTGIDPLETVDQHGADATRYGLLKISSTQDVRFSPGAIEEGRKLANKLWNVSRLILSKSELVTPSLRPHALEEQWILGRIDAVRAEVEEAWGRFDFAAATAALYHLTFDDFCDWYAEALKPRLYDGEKDAIATALVALERLLALLHPVLPHVTEEIWSYLPHRRARLIVSPWPEPDTRFADAVAALDAVQSAARTFRRSGVLVELATADEQRIFAAVVRPERQKAPGDVEVERARLQKEISRAETMLANERFVGNAPPDVVEAERAKLERYRASWSSWAHSAPSGRTRRLERRLMTNVDWLESLSPWPREEFGADRMRALLAAAGRSAGRAFPAVHVVGTNGKSTTTRMAGAAARPAACDRGVPSPHVRSWARARPGADPGRPSTAALGVSARPRSGFGATQFEMITAAAFVEFAGHTWMSRRGGRSRCRRSTRRDERARRRGSSCSRT